jgi:HAD superfamily hydrolase (TIGR01509 family)
MIDAVLCELEGVLVDTFAMRCRALRESFAAEGLALPDATVAASCGGRSTDDAVRAALPALDVSLDDVTATLIALRAERRFAELAGHGALLAHGATEFIERAQGRARLALVTRANRREVELLLGPVGLDTAFQVIVCAEDTPAQKPSPAPYEYALHRLARRRPVEREHVVALEDGLDGIRAAHAAGVRCVAVGALPAEVRAEADVAVPSLTNVSPATLDALITQAQEIIG